MAFPRMASALARQMPVPILASQPQVAPQTGMPLPQPPPRQILPIGGGPRSDALARALMQSGAGGEPIETGIEAAGKLAQLWSGSVMQERQIKGDEERKLAPYRAMAEALAGLSPEEARAKLPELLMNSDNPELMGAGIEILTKQPAANEWGFIEQDGNVLRTNKTTGAVEPAYGASPSSPSVRPMTPEEKKTYPGLVGSWVWDEKERKPVKLQDEVPSPDRPATADELDAAGISHRPGENWVFSKTDGYKRITDTNLLSPEEMAQKEVLAEKGADRIHLAPEENKFAAKSGELGAVRYDTLQLESLKASEMKGLYDIAEQGLASGVYTGFGGETLLNLQRLGVALGIADADQASGGELVSSITNRMALLMRNPDSGMGMPGAVSDRDLVFLKQAQIGIDRTPEGNRKMLIAGRAMEQRKIDIAKEADKYLAENKTLDAGFYRHIKEFAEANPIFTPDMFATGASAPSTSAPNPGAPVPTDPASDAKPLAPDAEGWVTLPDGTRIRQLP